MASATNSRPSRLFSTLLVLFSSIQTFVSAQTVLDTSKLPACASKCTTLTNANAACVPPDAPVSAQGTYQDCFCQSQLLTTLYTTPNGICTDVCSATDLQTIQTWYKGLCTGGVIVTPAGSAPKQTGTTTTGGTSTSTNGASSATSGTTAPQQTVQTGSWFHNHWKWVLLLIILFVAFVFFLTFGFWLKRRIRRRRAVKRFSGSGALQNAQSPSPFASGVLAPSDAAYMGSRNHPQMTVVPGAGSAATMERYGSPRSTTYGHEQFDLPNPPPAAAGAARNLPWVGSRTNSGGSGSKRSANAQYSPVSPVDADEAITEAEARGGRSKDGGSLKKKLSRKSKSGSRTRSFRRGDARN